MSAKKNFREHFECAGQVAGDKADKLDVCQATVGGNESCVNRREHDGRFCRITGATHCTEAVQGAFAGTIADRVMCEFYELVQGEEDRSLRIL